jgi:hypothetical protein
MQQVARKNADKERPLKILGGIIFLILFFIFVAGAGWAFTEKSQVLIMAFSALAGIFGFVGALLLLDR